MFVLAVLWISLLGAYALHLGLHGLMRKRPVIRWYAWGGPSIWVAGLLLALAGSWPPSRAHAGLCVMYLVMLAIGLIGQLRSSYFVVIGTTSWPLRKAVNAALDRLELRVEVRHPSIHIPSENIDLSVSRRAPGHLIVRVPQRSGKPLLQKIAVCLDEAIQAGQVEFDRTPFVVSTLLGLGAVGASALLVYLTF